MEEIDWTGKSWDEVGKNIAKLITDREDDEQFLQSLASKALDAIRNKEPDEKKRQSALSRLSRGLCRTFPRKESETPFYWHDVNGKGDFKKWRHNIFKYLTFGRGIKPIPDLEVETPSALFQPLSQETEPPANPPADPTTEQFIPKLKDMTIEALELDAETQQILSTALTQSGMALPDFIRQAVRVYAKTVTGKAKKQGEDLSTVSTEKLLNDPTYSTHPGRAEELTRRTIKAIKYYNANVATETADRWCITQSAIASLIGSRQSTIGKILESFKDEVETHNQTYSLNAYTNRKRGKDITEEIKLAELIPDGLD